MRNADDETRNKNKSVVNVAKKRRNCRKKCESEKNKWEMLLATPRTFPNAMGLSWKSCTATSDMMNIYHEEKESGR